MKFIKYLVVALAVALPLSATTFNFVFDSDFSSGIQAPLAGTGTFTFATDPGDGTHAFSSLGAFSMNFSFTSGDVFTEFDIKSDLALVRVVFSTVGSVRRLQFSDTGSGSGGPFLGSIDFENSLGRFLTFEPSSTGGNLDLYFESQLGLGSYNATLATSVPDDGSTALLAAIGLVVVFAGTRRRFTR
ncbi:MAG: hypothetical protein JNN01_13040 [Opitutaceae bacterium]|nr:hypothetical protein [Opitutaceae bacterium]